MGVSDIDAVITAVIQQKTVENTSGAMRPEEIVKEVRTFINERSSSGVELYASPDPVAVKAALPLSSDECVPKDSVRTRAEIRRRELECEAASGGMVTAPASGSASTSSCTPTTAASESASESACGPAAHTTADTEAQLVRSMHRPRPLVHGPVLSTDTESDGCSTDTANSSGVDLCDKHLQQKLQLLEEVACGRDAVLPGGPVRVTRVDIELALPAEAEREHAQRVFISSMDDEECSGAAREAVERVRLERESANRELQLRQSQEAPHHKKRHHHGHHHRKKRHHSKDRPDRPNSPAYPKLSSSPNSPPSAASLSSSPPSSCSSSRSRSTSSPRSSSSVRSSASPRSSSSSSSRRHRDGHSDKKSSHHGARTRSSRSNNNSNGQQGSANA
jgi:hypothetical protein